MAKTFGLLALLRRNDGILKAAFSGAVVYALTIAAVTPALNAAVQSTYVLKLSDRYMAALAEDARQGRSREPPGLSGLFA